MGGTNNASLNLSNKDSADLVGSLIFNGAGGARPYWKRYSVDVQTNYGPWGDCNFIDGQNVCSHDLPPHVGRSGGQSLNGTQCGPAANVGLWYSFPAVGECKPGTKVGTDGCTWKATWQKTLAGDCLKKYNDGAFYK